MDAPKKNESINLFNSFRGSTSNPQGKPALSNLAKTSSQTQPQKIIPSNIPRGFVQPAAKPVSQPAILRSAPPSEPMRPRNESSSVLGSKSKFICQKCGYKYSLDMSIHKKNDCPWCGFTQPK